MLNLRRYNATLSYIPIHKETKHDCEPKSEEEEENKETAEDEDTVTIHIKDSEDGRTDGGQRGVHALAIYRERMEEEEGGAPETDEDEWVEMTDRFTLIWGKFQIHIHTYIYTQHNVSMYTSVVSLDICCLLSDSD